MARRGKGKIGLVGPSGLRPIPVKQTSPQATILRAKGLDTPFHSTSHRALHLASGRVATRQNRQRLIASAARESEETEEKRPKHALSESHQSRETHVMLAYVGPCIMLICM